MGTIEFKQQLIDTAVAMGTLKKVGDGQYETLKGTAVSSKNFTEGLQDQWLTTEALTKTLGKYTDETTEIGKKALLQQRTSRPSLNSWMSGKSRLRRAGARPLS